MKKMIFKKVVDVTTGKEELVAVVKEVKGLQADGSTVSISDSLLNEALKVGLAERMQFGKGYDTTFYKFNDITLIRVNKDKVIIVDSEVVSNEWIGDTFKNKGISVARVRGKEIKRGVCRVSMANVRHLDRRREKEVETKNYNVSLSLVLWDLKLGNISGVNLQKDEVYNIVNMESHHEKAVWDNRIESTVRLTSENHRKYHSVNGEESHQIACTITSLEELQAFLEYLKNN